MAHTGKVSRLTLFGLVAFAAVLLIFLVSLNLNKKDLRGSLIPQNLTVGVYVKDVTVTGTTGTASLYMKSSVGNDLASFQAVIYPATNGLTLSGVTNAVPVLGVGNVTLGQCALSSWTVTPTTTPAGGFLIEGLKGFCPTVINTTNSQNDPGAELAHINFTLTNPTPNQTFDIKFNDAFTTTVPVRTGFTQFLYPQTQGPSNIPQLTSPSITMTQGGVGSFTPANYSYAGTITYQPTITQTYAFGAPTYSATEGGTSVTIPFNATPSLTVSTAFTFETSPASPSISINGSVTGNVALSFTGGSTNLTFLAPSDNNSNNDIATLTAKVNGLPVATTNLTAIDSTVGLSLSGLSTTITEEAAATAITVGINPAPTVATTVTLSSNPSYLPTTLLPISFSTNQAGPFNTLSSAFTLVFNPGDLTKTIYIQALADANTTNETGNTITATVTNPLPTSYTPTTSANFNIIDNDVPNIGSVDLRPMTNSTTVLGVGLPVYRPYYGVKAEVNFVGPPLGPNDRYKYTWTSTGSNNGNLPTHIVTQCVAAANNVFVGNSDAPQVTTNTKWDRSGHYSEWNLLVELFNNTGCTGGQPLSQATVYFNIANQAPSFITTLGPGNVQGGTWNGADNVMEVVEEALPFFKYQIRATDIENDSMTYSISGTNPWTTVPGLALSTTGATQNGVDLVWNTPLPAENRAGDMTLVITVSDGNGASATQTSYIRVKNANDAPIISYINPTAIVNNQTQPVQFSDGTPAALPFLVTDGEVNIAPLQPPLGQVITMVPNPALPAWMSFNTTTKVLTVSATQAQVGSSGTISFTATDNPTQSPIASFKWDCQTCGLNSTSTFTFPYVVVNTNDNPVISPNLPPSSNAMFTKPEDTPIVMDLTNYGSDPDTGDVLSWSVVTPITGNTNAGTTGGTVFDFPADITYSSNNKVITITPNANAYNTNPITITLQLADNHFGVATVTRDINWTAVNDAPIISTNANTNGYNIHDIEPVTGVEDQPAPLTVDLTNYKYDVDDLPANLTYSVGAADYATTQITSATFAGNILSVTPALNFNGNAAITVHVTDDNTPTAGTSTYALQLRFTPTPDAPSWLDWPGKIGSGASNLYSTAYVGSLYVLPLEPLVLEPDTGDNLYFTTSNTNLYSQTTVSGIHQYRWIPLPVDLGLHTFPIYVSNNPSLTMANHATTGGVPAGYAPDYVVTINVLPASSAIHVLTISASDSTHVILTYDHSADIPDGSPENPLKYTFSGGLTTSAVASLGTPVDFRITTNAQLPGQSYTLYINGVKFLNGQTLNNYSVTFTGYGGTGQPCTTNCPPPPPPPGSGMLGDANLSNSVTAADALLVLQHYVGLPTTTTINLCRANANQTGGVDSADALKILQKVVGSTTLGTVNCP